MRSLANAPGVALLAAGGVLWGGAGAVGRLLTRAGEVGSLQVATFRALLGGLVLVGAGLALGRPRVVGRQAWRHVALMAVLTVGYQTSYFAAVAAGSLALATLVALGSGPVFVTLAHAVRDRRVSPAQVGLVVMALVGLGLLIGRPEGVANVGVVTTLALIAGAVFATITLVNENPIPGYDHITGTGVSFVIAGVAMAVALAVVPGPALATSPAVWGWLLVLAVACTAAPYACYFTGLLRTSAPTASLFALLEPLTGTLLAVAVFGERLGLVGWVGAALLLGAVLLSGLRRR